MADDAETSADDAPEGDAPAPKRRRQKEGCLVRMTPVTTPGCASCLTSVFLITTVATVWIAFLLDANNVPWRHSMSFLRIGATLLLTALIPYVVYKMIQWWLEGEKSKFPDLDYAWQYGLHALASNGISLTTTPLYLVLGSSSETQERSLLAAAGLRLRVEGVPEGPAPLHWYANSDGIYLFCSDACWTSAIASLREELAADAAARGMPVSESPFVVNVPPPEASSFGPPEPSAPEPPPAPIESPPAIRGTLMLDQFMAQQNPRAANRGSEPSLPAVSGGSPRGTLMLDAYSGPSAGQSVGTGMGASPTSTSNFSSYRQESDIPSNMEPVLVAPQYTAVCLQQLQYLGELLRRSRQPVCPMNGLLMLIQFESIHSTPAEMDELQKALRADLSTIQYATQLRAPITALIVGLERERGFRELVRRVGKDRAATQRFGRKFDVRAIPTEEELAALSAHVCGAFEDWAYTLFREENSLSRPGNTRLYELLSKVRCSWKTRLGDLLAGGFGCDQTAEAQAESHLFSGCYLAATGETPDRQAFAKGVIDKLQEEQELVEWTPDALQTSRRQATFTNAGMLVTLFLFCTLVVMYILGWFR